MEVPPKKHSLMLPVKHLVRQSIYQDIVEYLVIVLAQIVQWWRWSQIMGVKTVYER